jgi:hypothetical protein
MPMEGALFSASMAGNNQKLPAYPSCAWSIYCANQRVQNLVFDSSRYFITHLSPHSCSGGDYGCVHKVSNYLVNVSSMETNLSEFCSFHLHHTFLPHF